MVGGFIGTITQGESTLTVMNPVGAGLSEPLAIGQIIEATDLDVFSGTTKITGITTGLVDLRDIESLVGIAETLSKVNILTVDSTALRSVRAPLNDGNYGNFEVLDDPANFADSGREKYSLPKDADPFIPQTVGIMQTANLGIGGRISLDNSGDPKGSQSWDPALDGLEIPMDPTNYRILTKVVPPTVGAEKSYWMVGFQTAPNNPGTIYNAYEGESTGSIDSNALGGLLSTLSACSADSNTDISNAIGILTTKEASFTDEDGRNNLLVDATNALREERNELCMRIWGNRTAIGDLNNKITRYESLRGFINMETIEDIVE